MAHCSTYQGIEFVSDEKDQSDLHAWYDHLRKSEVKNSITRVTCRDYRPYDQASFRVIVLCKHPFSSGAMSFGEDDTLINCRLDVLAPEFAHWIEQNRMPAEAMIGNRYACIDWWPEELANHILNDLPAQGQAQWEMDSHHLDCLELIRLAAISDQEFAELWRNSNEPFFAAGRLTVGEFQWIREVPFGYLGSQADGETLLERVGEYSREFVGLLRLALSIGAESPLLDHVSAVLRRFSADYVEEIPQWLELARNLLDETDEMPRDVNNHPIDYVKIDEACDQLRRKLVEAAKGLEQEVVTVINAVLPTLEVPQSSMLFTDEEDRQPT